MPLLRKLLPWTLVVLTAATGLAFWASRSPETPSSDRAGPAWAGLDAQSRCDRAVSLVTHPVRWPVRCRWRSAGERVQGQAFPPPKGPPPYDDPHVQIYVAPDQSEHLVANAIAHEFGHMHHTREPTFVADWLAVRNLPAGTPDEVWTEDYAEVFAALYSPPSPHWRAPTTRPSPDALAALEARFFA